VKERAVAFGPEALDDLVELYDWLADRASPAVAIGYVDRIKAFCTGLSVGAERGGRRDDVRPGLRIVGFEHRVTIAFSVESDRVVILRLLNGGRDWETILSDDAP